MQEYGGVLLCNSQDKKEKLDKPKGKKKSKDIGSKEVRFQLPSYFMMEGQMRCNLFAGASHLSCSNSRRVGGGSNTSGLRMGSISDPVQPGLVNPN